MTTLRRGRLHLVPDADYTLNAAQLAFEYVGKHSSAYDAALAVFWGKTRPSPVLTQDHLLGAILRLKQEQPGVPR